MLLRLYKFILRRKWPFMVAPGLFFPDKLDDEESKQCSIKDKLKLEQPNIKELNYNHMIQLSTVDAANSASRALTVTYSAILSASNEYRTLLNELIDHLQEAAVAKVSESHWDKIIELRVAVQDKKEIVTRLISYMDSVHKMAMAASEVGYISGMEGISDMLCQRIDDALQKIQNEVKLNVEIEENYLEAQKDCIKQEGT